VCATRAGDIAQGFPDVLLIYSGIEERIHPAQRIHRIGNIVQPTLSPVVAQRAVDAFSGEYFTEMSHVVFPGRRDACAEEVACLGVEQLLRHRIGPVWRACLTHACVLACLPLGECAYCLAYIVMAFRHFHKAFFRLLGP